MNLAHYVGALNLLGDESRLRLCVLLRERELAVTDLVRVTGISQSRVSTHLARLREGGFVRDRREALAKRAAQLHALSPLAILSRGYAVALDAQGRALTDADAARAGDALTLRLHRGALAVEVKGNR